jgi:hypothetical protein
MARRMALSELPMAGQLGMGDAGLFLVPRWRDRAARCVELDGMERPRCLVVARAAAPQPCSSRRGRDATLIDPFARNEGVPSSNLGVDFPFRAGSGDSAAHSETALVSLFGNTHCREPAPAKNGPL